MAGTWSYDPACSTQRDQVRFLVQDTNTNKQVFFDEEINWVLSEEANVYTAAACLCEQLIARSGGMKSKKISEFGVSWDPQFYIALAATLRARGAGHQVPYAGGISVSDKLVQQADTDAVTPSFVRNLDENPAAPKPEVPSNNPLTSI